MALKVAFDLYKWINNIDQGKRKALCEDLQKMADLLSEIKDCLVKGEVPSKQGGTFIIMMNNPSPTLQELSKEKLGLQEILNDDLKLLTHRLNDADIYLDQIERDTRKNAWPEAIRSMSRGKQFKDLMRTLDKISGRLEGYAMILRPGR